MNIIKGFPIAKLIISLICNYDYYDDHILQEPVLPCSDAGLGHQMPAVHPGEGQLLHGQFVQHGHALAPRSHAGRIQSYSRQT